jgi:hypothetical protein
MTKQEIVAILNDHEWKFAKTFKYKAPHWYTLREKWNDDPLFDKIVQEVRNNANTEYFWRKPFEVLTYEGWKYWSMGAPIDETILINKAFDSGQYNDIAWNYDKLFDEQSFQEENEEIADMLNSPSLDKVYDVGCGTGLLLELLDIAPQDYIGIDPSWSMIKVCREKFPEHKFLIDKLETYRTFHLKEDATVVSLFGSMNYVLPEYLDRVRDFGSKYFLMFYAWDYEPITYDKTGKKFYHHKHSLEKLKAIYNEANVFEWKNYYIVSNG